MSGLPKRLKTAFIENYYSFATPEDVPESQTAREALALGHLSWGAKRQAGRMQVRVFDPVETEYGFGHSHTVIETITDDSPFIVDSLTMHLNALSQGVLVKLHSVFCVDRDEAGVILACEPMRPEGTPGTRQRGHAESWTHFEIPRVLEIAELRSIERQLTACLRDVKVAVRDWPRMLQALRKAADDLRRFGKGKDVAASAEFLDWLANENFTVLGYCALPTSKGKRSSSATATGRWPTLGLLRAAQRRESLHRLNNDKAAGRETLTITKSTLRSTVHRPALLDDISIDMFDDAGHVIGEHRFVGLFTSLAYNENPRDIPLLRSKVDHVMRRSGLEPSGHRGKALRHILDTFPRDELIQGSVAELERIGTGVLNIEERRKIRLFMRKSAYGDFYSFLIYLPRDGYSSRARKRIESLLQETMSGKLIDSQVTISESTLARLTVLIQRDNPKADLPSVGELQKQLMDVAASWIDKARLALLEKFSEEQALALHHRYAASFPIAYQESISGDRLSRDFAAVADFATGHRSEFYSFVAVGTRATFTVMLPDKPVPLYLANPILENMGVKLLQETSYLLETGKSSLWMQDFIIEARHGESLDSEGLAPRFEQCFACTFKGEVENDGFNQLIVAAGLDWRQVVVLRTYCKYLQQCRIQFSQAYILDTLRRHPVIVGAFIALFACYFDPGLRPADRERDLPAELATIRRELDLATNLDDDRILRMFSAAIQATLRTNYYQQANGKPKSWLSIKLDPASIPEVPEPRPQFEIFVYSRLVEGAHLRGGEIARGGIRWSDRREDFRTEVLGLMKAQQVKNTVIVPAGAKGGFVLKSPPDGDRAALQQHVVECYKTFLRGLLDLTDNIVGNRTIGPRDTICRDKPDPYLVVAADKGTATFSDTANAVAAEYDFWLGDAFASGGSAGYDHKKMGITARGAWESVKRHFREMGVDSQRDPFTVVGIGDMSGDVFGNGMLLSKQIRLVAAFNHKHIFIDPNPDQAKTFAERKRLFALPRSGWEDYNPKLLSKGGGIFDRQSKSIKLSAEACTALGIEKRELSPPELIRAVLLAPVDLLWNGGIGTYVKASGESESAAADPANDPVRVDGNALRAKVLAEGGNLGLTQRGRIEFALAGGRINTDFIDNTGGVDSSDREVNIKILFSDAIRRKTLAPNRRNALLASMTDEVAELVLASNYAQTQALSMMASKAHERIGEHGRLIRILESRGLLNRSLEFLPGEEEIDERKRAGKGFTRPELAIILSYAKIELFDSLIETAIPDEKYCQAEVTAYFPQRLGKRFEKSIRSHRLRREIAAMLISSSMINRMGPFFALRAEEDTGADVADVARAYAIVRSLFETRNLWQEIEALDGKLQAQVQYDCFFECSRMIRRAVYWFLHRSATKLKVGNSIERNKKEISRLRAELPGVLCGWAKRSFEREASNYESLGVPRKLSERIAGLRLMSQVLDIADLAHELAVDPLVVARLHFELGRGLRLDWIRGQIEDLKVEGHWRAMARGTLRETLGREQHALLHGILKRAGKGDYRLAMADWLTSSNSNIARLKRTLEEIQASGQMDFATLSIALKEISRLH